MGSQDRYVRVPGYYLEDMAKDRRKDALPEGGTDRIRLGPHYVFSIRRFRLSDLEVTNIKKYAGAFFNPQLVYGVIDLDSASLVKFYILEKDVKELREATVEARGDDIMLGSFKMRYA